jgi:membrane protein DedA with SNARE-associated domain
VLDQLVHTAEPWLHQYGYVALFAAMFFEGAGIPAPALTLLVAAVLLAERGELHLFSTVALAFLGIVSGCQLGYALGRSGGRRLLLRFGRMNRHQLASLQTQIKRWGTPLLIAAPFFDGTRQTTSLIAGTAGLAWLRFTLPNLFGAALWVGAWSAAVDRLGQSIEPLLHLARASAPLLIVAALALLIALFARRAWRRR